MWQRSETIYCEGHVLVHNAIKVQTSGFKRGTVVRGRQNGQVQLRKDTRLALDKQGIRCITYRRDIP